MFALERRPSSETEVPYVSGIFSRTLQISFARVHVYLYFLYIVLRNSGRDWHRWKRKQLTRREDATTSGENSDDIQRNR